MAGSGFRSLASRGRMPSSHPGGGSPRSTGSGGGARAAGPRTRATDVAVSVASRRDIQSASCASTAPARRRPGGSGAAIAVERANLAPARAGGGSACASGRRRRETAPYPPASTRSSLSTGRSESADCTGRRCEARSHAPRASCKGRPALPRRRCQSTSARSGRPLRAGAVVRRCCPGSLSARGRSWRPGRRRWPIGSCPGPKARLRRSRAPPRFRGRKGTEDGTVGTRDAASHVPRPGRRARA